MRMLSPLAAGTLFAAIMMVASPGPAQQLLSDSPAVKEVAPADGSRSQPLRRNPYERPQTLIACTRSGCQPIPPGCRIEIERNWDGLPTGFDAIICPFR